MNCSQLTRPSWLFSLALAIPPGSPSIEIKGFRLVEVKQEFRQFEMQAVSAQLFKPEEIIALNKLEAKVWGKLNRPYVLRGELGIMDSDSQNFRVLRKTEVHSPEGYKFQTSNVHYDQKSRLLSSDDPVEATNLNSKTPFQFKINGVGLLINLEKREYEILKKVKTKQAIDQAHALFVNSSRVLFSPANNRATFRSGVSVTSPTINLRGDRLQITFAEPSSSQTPNETTGFRPDEMLLDSPSPRGFPKKLISAELPDLKLTALGMKINLASDGSLSRSEAIGAVEGVAKGDVQLKAERLISEQIENQQRVLLKDKVEIITDSRVAKCQDAIYYPESGDIILQNIASVTSGDQVIEGELIRFSTKNSEIFVESARGQINKSEVFDKKQK